VSPGSILEAVSPYARVGTAVAPLLIAIAVRLLFGRGRMAGWLLTAASIWLAANMLMAPYSPHMQRDIATVRALFR
jgi:hypothetical protein